MQRSTLECQSFSLSSGYHRRIPVTIRLTGINILARYTRCCWIRQRKEGVEEEAWCGNYSLKELTTWMMAMQLCSPNLLQLQTLYLFILQECQSSTPFVPWNVVGVVRRKMLWILFFPTNMIMMRCNLT